MPSRLRGVVRSALAVALALGCVIGTAAPASAPGVGPAQSPAPGPDPAGSELDRARRALEHVLALSPDTPLWDEQRSSLGRLIALLGARERQGATAAAPPEAVVPMASTLAGTGPYPVAAVDALRDEADALVGQKASLEVSLRVLDSDLAALVSARRGADEALRLKQEQFERAGSSADKGGQLRAEADLARMQARVAELEVARADAERRRGQARLQIINARLASLEREIARVRAEQVIDEPALDGIGAASRAARQRLTKEQGEVRARLTSAEARAERGDRGALRIAAAQRATLAALAELDQIEQGREEAWRMRSLALAPDMDPQRRASARALLGTAIEQIDARLRAATDQIGSARVEARAQRSQLDALAPGDPQRAAEQRVLDALTQGVDARERVQEQLARLKVLLTRSRDDIEVASEPRSFTQWLTTLAARVRQAAASIWDYELFSASESSVVEGRTVTLDYGVTVGKSIGALGLFVLGYWAARLLTLRLVGQAVRRAGVSEQYAKVLYRWVMWLLGLAVLIVVLKLARIPLTAFAFLGGALAIGVGFGTQNIIKNLISGLIILFERKVRVGDIVSIGSVSGTVTAVDLRATTVREFNGIEVIVPNSHLLENLVSNWTFPSPMMRREVTVNVAYGADLRQARRVLLECAAANPDVLASPAPDVLLADFGSDGVEMRLQFWITLGQGVAGPVIESDLRFALESGLRQAGISIPFPQRDVHLRVDSPLPAAVVASAGEPP
ncbi:MAG: mechanosensitive ion channel [Piscinibacter sp.]|nr:mechanosensitive ion channel [Piscinibacter sp.]